MNTIVNFEIAKLLKEKGFEFKVTWKYILSFKNNAERDKYLPTITEVVMWLYEKHGIWTEVTYLNNVGNFGCIVTVMEDNSEAYEKYYCKTPTDAYSAAIIYALNNLI